MGERKIEDPVFQLFSFSAFQLFSPLRPSPFALSPSPFALRPSPFALRPSPFALRPSPFALRPSPFALRSSPLALHALSPLTLSSPIISIENLGKSYALHTEIRLPLQQAKVIAK